MLRRSTVAIAVALALMPMTGHGLGLGQIRSSSGLNQPFEGEIDLTSVSADEISQVKVRLAPADAYARAGVELTGSLGKLEFKPYVKPNGQAAIRVSSADNIREPFLDFLIEVEWPQGKTVKEYTVLLDPPIFTERRGARVRPAEAAPAPTPAAAPKAAAVRAAAAPKASAVGGESYGRVRRGETLWSIAEKTKPAGVSTQKALAAIYAANPQAFIRGDMNKLREGAELRLPAPAEYGVSDVAGTRRDYLEQARDTGGGAPATAAASPEPTDRLRLLTPPAPAETPPPAEAAMGASPAAGALRQDLLIAQEKAESALQTAEQLQGRVADLETQLRDMQRLVLLKEEQLAQLQRQSAAAAAAPPPASPAPTPPVVAPAPEPPAVAQAPQAPPPLTEAPVVPAPPAAPTPPAEPPVAAAPVAVPAAAPEPPVAAAAPVPAAPAEPVPSAESRPVEPAPPATPAEPVAPVKSEPAVAAPVVAERPAPAPVVEPVTAAPAARPAPAGGFAALLQDPASLVGIGIAGVGVLGALLWAVGGRRRKDQEAEGAEAEMAAEPKAEKPTTPVPAAPGETPPVAAAPVAAVAPAAAAVAAAGAVRAETVEPERVSTEDLAALELSTTDLFGLKGETTEVDPTEEADVYIAYGRYEQAEQLLRLALEMEPGRLALKHKLLEVYFASRDASAFGSLFGEMRAAGSETEDPQGWQRALRMGRQLDPANPVYSGTAVADEDLEAALREAERGLAADLEAGAPDLGALKIDTHYAEAAPDLDGGSVLNDLSLDLGTEEASDKGSHPFKLDVSEELSELRTPTSLGGDLDDNDLAKASAIGGGFSLDEITGQDLEQAEERVPDLSGIELTMESAGGDQDTTLVHADTTLELVDDVETKLDLARAYIELGDGEGARVMLREVMQEGNDAQKANAEAMLKELS